MEECIMSKENVSANVENEEQGGKKKKIIYLYYAAFGFVVGVVGTALVLLFYYLLAVKPKEDEKVGYLENPTNVYGETQGIRGDGVVVPMSGIGIEVGEDVVRVSL